MIGAGAKAPGPITAEKTLTEENTLLKKKYSHKALQDRVNLKGRQNDSEELINEAI